jgi:hypothetical protein
MDGWTEGWTNGYKDRETDRQKDIKTNGGKAGRMDGWKSGFNKRMDSEGMERKGDRQVRNYVW